MLLGDLRRRGRLGLLAAELILVVLGASGVRLGLVPMGLHPFRGPFAGKGLASLCPAAQGQRRAPRQAHGDHDGHHDDKCG